jgi:hypothetical protein
MNTRTARIQQTLNALHEIETAVMNDTCKLYPKASDADHKTRLHLAVDIYCAQLISEAVSNTVPAL